MSEITPASNDPLNISGIVLSILPLQSGTSKAGNQWQKQDFILEKQGQYPRKVCVCLFGDNVEKFPQQGVTVPASQPAVPPTANKQANVVTAQAPAGAPTAADDLPF